MSKLKGALVSLCLLAAPLLAKPSEGRFLNPITDICWKCVFPLHVAGKNVTPNHKDPINYSPGLCYCAGMPPKAGIPIAFWEPAYVVEVTRTPYKFPSLGGLDIRKSGVRKRGTISNVGESGRSSFYNVHFYRYPIMNWLEVLDDFPCVEEGDFDLGYLSEVDPTWNDAEWATVLNAESYLFANPVAQTACVADCALSTLGKPSNKLFWCAGCAGSLYPFVGHVPHHVGNIQASHLLVQRVLAKLHSINQLQVFEKDNFCKRSMALRLKKPHYKTQLVYPVANSKGPCPTLGASEVLWGSGKSYPYGGEDFVYIIWVKKHCCLDAVNSAIKAATQGAA